MIQRVSVNVSVAQRPPCRPWPEALEPPNGACGSSFTGEQLMWHAGVEPPRDRQPALLVACHDSRGQPVLRVVGDRDRFSVVAEGDHRRHGPEDFILVDLHVGRHPRQYGRLDKAPVDLAAKHHLAPFATASSICSFTLAACLSLISGPMTFDLSSGRRPSAAGAGDEAAQELVVDVLVHQHLLHRHADLALVHEAAEARRGARALEVGVVADDERVLAAELDAAFLQVSAGTGGDLAADRGRAGEEFP